MNDDGTLTYHHSFRKRGMRLFLLIVIVFLVLAFDLPMSVKAQSTQGSLGMERIPGHLVPVLQHAQPLGLTDPQQQLHLSITLKLRNQTTLDALLLAQSDPTSLLYHHYLTPQAFITQFGPTQATVNAVVTYLHQQHFTVSSITPNRLIVDAEGTVATVQGAFQTELDNYRVQSRVVYAPVVDPLLPIALGNAIEMIGGLNNVVQFYPVTPQSVHKPIYRQLDPVGGLTPNEIRTAYNVQPLLSAGADGAGQTIGLVELTGYNPADINTYLQYYKLGAPKYAPVLVDGVTNHVSDNSLEAALDMEMTSAIAPGARQKVYIGSNSASGEIDLYNRIVTDNAVNVVTTSWGGCELDVVRARLDTLNDIFQEGAAQGQAFFAASGDAGAYDCGTDNIAVDSVANDPYVVGVGGTILHLGAGGTYVSETAWEDAHKTPAVPQGKGSGGGISTHFFRHSFQHGPNLTNIHRMIPDVSANADPEPGYSVYCTICTSAGFSGWGTLGGTSAAAPLWAAMAADINQYLQKQNRSDELGNAIITLYDLYNLPQPYPPYHDITIGTNLYYPAGPGYDLATGMGSPNVWNITRDIVHMSEAHASKNAEAKSAR